jgi:multidrug efflux pump subunit AcrA (membrane-fusion protein)
MALTASEQQQDLAKQQQAAEQQKAAAEKQKADKAAQDKAAADKAAREKADRDKVGQQKTQAEKDAHARGTTLAQEQAEKAKVDREREIMRDPHEKDVAKKSANAFPPMPTFKDKQGNVVSALQIKEVKEVDHGDTELHFINQNYAPVRVKAPWVTVNLPRATGWFVADRTGTRYMDAQTFTTNYQRGGAV